MPSEETLRKKQEIINSLKEKIEKSKAIFLADFSTLTVAEFESLRNSMRELNSEIKVVKNTMFRRAVEGTDYSQLIDKITGPTAVIFVEGDPIEVSKAVIKFKKETKKLPLKGGIFEKTLLSEDDIVEFSKLPSYTEMISMTVGAVAAPLSSFVGLLNNLIASLARVINEIASKNSESQ